MKTNTEYQQFAPLKETIRGAHLGCLEPTPSDIEGPFYKANAPEVGDHPLCDPNPVELTITGRVVDTHGKPIASAVLDVWHADATGEYDNIGVTNRGKVRASPTGAFTIKTIMPGDYKISGDGEPDDFRCSHIHFKVSALGFKTLTTQLYFPDDPYNKTDHWFDARRVITHPDGYFQFVLESKGS